MPAVLGTQTRNGVVAILVVALVLSMPTEQSLADSCSDIISGAQSGRPSNWEELFSSWGWGDDACWKQWPDATTSRIEAQRICDDTGRELH
jgi:hypothetical protein